MQKKLMLIVNPVSGKGQAKSALADILIILCAHFQVTVFITEKSGDATELAKMHGAEYDIAACIGGDGTLSEMLSGIMQLENRPTVGYIPMGTTNDLATSLKIPKRPKSAALNLVNGVPQPLDVGKLGDKYFSYVAAFGAFTEVTYTTPQETKNALGHLAYILEGMAHLGSIVPYHAIVEFDDEKIEGDFVFGAVTNSTSVAGLVKLDPVSVGLNDGDFEVILVKNPKNLADFNSIISSVLTQNYDPENVVFFHCKKVNFTFPDEPVTWTRDGENGGTFQSIAAENCHSAVTIFVPEAFE